ncbi:MAG: PD-(D/E)XK nuclease family protein [Planctomycetales bacterium]|nr:PD-(D/E)XK nuclease family protein [Planctomycetales bacterium]
MSFDLFPELDCQRQFMGWQSPLLPNVVRYFIDQTASDGSHHSDKRRLDLGDWVCALPTAQSAIRFSSLLSSMSAAAELEIVLPEVLTAGDLAETLYRPQHPIAIEFEQTLAWSRVLRRQDPLSLRPLLPVLPESESLGPWLELAGTLRRLSSDLAAHNVSFADVLEVSETGAERERWNLLQLLFDLYLDELAEAGLGDQHDQRRIAVKKKTIRSAKKIALIGTSDLNESVARVLRNVNQDVVAFIAAPQQKQSYFDTLGRLKTENFAEFHLAIRDDQLIPAGDITDQVSAAGEVVTEFASRHPASQITLGVTDESHVAPTEMQLENCGFSSYRHLGWTVASTAVGRLMDLTADLVARPTWRSLASLVRHGDFHRYMQNRIGTGEGDFLVQLDQLMANHFPVRLADPLPPSAIDKYPRAIELRDAVYEWLSPLVGGSISDAAKVSDRLFHKQPIAQWCEGILHWLDSTYAGLPSDENRLISRQRSIDAISKVRELLLRFTKLSRHLDVAVTAGTALETLAGRLSDLRIGRVRQDDDVQIHGWLDLALDDAPAMVVLGLNHPFVPSAVTSDPFLPGSLRTKLRVADNQRRYARDVYATQLILSTRRDVKFIVGKTSADGSPTPPSRLLSAAPAEDVARRVRNLLLLSRKPVETIHRWDNAVLTTSLPIPTISDTECPVKSMSVTAFKAYLDCPYRFYLRHVLGLKPVDDSASELAANQFGDLVHGAVEHFGQSSDKDESDPKRIFEALRHHLHEYALANYGRHAESAVQLQIRQAQRRLEFVATEQAKRIDAGWRIHATEASVNESEGACVIVDGKRMGLRGRFDRIDRHEQTGRWAILDYKTHGHKPEKKHLQKNRQSGEYEWIDLQLPLYRMMVPFLGIDVPPQEVQLGYFNVSDKADETKINIADFTEPLMKQAEQLIHQCVRNIFACQFSPTENRVMYDDYEMILQTGVASRMLAGASLADGETEQ